MYLITTHNILYPTFLGARRANSQAINGNATFPAGTIQRATLRRRFVDGDTVALVDSGGMPISNRQGVVRTYIAGSRGLKIAMGRLGGTPMAVTTQPLIKAEQAVIA